jgi:tetratricopeptide (TPR) repeat protein
VAEHGLARADEVVRAALEAEQLVRGMPEVELRLRLLLELGRVWAPENHYSHPVRDFRRAAETAREVRGAARPGGQLARSALQSLARATRYRTDGDLQGHLREAERLYEQCVQEYETAGEHDVAAHVRTNLAELRSARGAGDFQENQREGIQAARARIAEGGPAEPLAKARLSLAYHLTLLGSKQPRSQGRATLSEAREVFESIDRSSLTPSELLSADNYHTICLADLALLEGRHEEAVLLWRRRLESLGPEVSDVVRAYTVHNLADMLMRPGSRLEWVLEGLRLSEQALEVRTLERNPEHHWETCENIGRTTAHLLRVAHGLPASDFRQRWERGRKALRDALTAARRIGSHERLLKSASALLELARVAPSVAALETTAEEGWSALDEARPYFLLDDHAGVLEAHLAAAMAETLAQRLAERGPVGVSRGLGFVLSGERTEPVLRWMVRAAGAAQRRLAGRTAHPEGVPHGTWVEWLAASRSGDARAIGRALDTLRGHVPLFLRGEPDLAGTWSWLRSRPGSVAVAVISSPGAMMAAVLTHDGQPRALIARLDVKAPPHDADTVARDLSAQGPGEAYRALLEWARGQVIASLTSLLPPEPSQLLWVPTGVLRVLAPADLWPSMPVTCAVRLDLETRSAPPRPRRTLLAVADPGPGSPRSIPGSVELGASLALTAQTLGPLRVRMSRGAAWGTALGVPCPELVEGPASADDILRELAGVDVAMLLCHGEVAGPTDAQLLLVDGSGAVVPLRMQRLAEDPHLVAGTTIVLLSCETGRAGDWLHQATGLAGALLAGGARNVIAPLWPVLLDPAWKVGHAMLGALASQGDLSATLQRLTAPESGPALGGRAGAQRQQEQAWSLRAFVRWVA